MVVSKSGGVFVASEDSVALLKTGEIDYANVSFGALQELAGLQHLSVQSATSPTLITYIAYNLDRSLLQDRRVRQTLTQALDRQAIVNSLLSGRGEVLDSSIPHVSWAQQRRAEVPYDVEAAKHLLAQAGWTPGADGVLHKDGTRLAFTL